LITSNNNNNNNNKRKDIQPTTNKFHLSVLTYIANFTTRLLLLLLLRCIEHTNRIDNVSTSHLVLGKLGLRAAVRCQPNHGKLALLAEEQIRKEHADV
jgi:hypothetical protein